MFTSCDEPWNEGDPAMEHYYYIGFEDWGTQKNDVVYTVNKGATIEIPVQFHSERVRKYDVTTFYYVSSAEGELVRGKDYEIVDASGSVLTPDGNGGFPMTWSQAIKGVKNVYVKALNGAEGSFNVQTFNPNAGAIKHPDNILNNMTNDYQVDAFSQNYKVKVTIK